MKRIFYLVLLFWFSHSNAQTLKIVDLFSKTSMELNEVKSYFKIHGLNKISQEDPHEEKLGNVVFVDPKQTSGDTIFPFKYMYSNKTNTKRLIIQTDKQNFETYLQELQDLNFKVINANSFKTLKFYQYKKIIVIAFSPIEDTNEKIKYKLSIINEEDFNNHYKIEIEK